MSSKRPLALYDGAIRELQEQDALSIIALDYYRSTRLAAKTFSVAADRCILAMPSVLGVTINGVWRQVASPANIDINASTNWDSAYASYATAATRAGKDIYLYACVSAGALVFVLSPSATAPTGYSATTSRKIGGFHCLCLGAGTISGHPLSGYATGDILPMSVWDLKHRPLCDPEGMVYVDGLRIWADIYLASVEGGKLVSKKAGTIADGTSPTAFDWYDFVEWFGRIGKQLPTQAEFMALSDGSNQGTNISGSADPVTTGGHVDTASQRMISNVGCEDACGSMMQWVLDPGGPYGVDAWVQQYSTRTAQRGVSALVPNRCVVGGHWSLGTNCGSRFSVWNKTCVDALSSVSARGVAAHVEA